MARCRLGSELTDREHQVLYLLKEGLSLPEIAITMGIAYSTARTHMERIHGRLGSKTQADAVVKGLKAGILEL